MTWQDLVITVVIIVFTVSLIPQVYHGFKRKKGLVTKRSSISTLLGLVVISYAYFTLDLYFSAIMSVLLALLWLFLLIQRVVYEKV